ncbi:MAG: heme-binding protein [Bradyrhizobium sp.]|uniref:SOUL family heme-binding protein n=1 Tax=Bradyrhizobium sp. TaxID=376 RepID=UPI00271DAAA7|nr:heme-binding protein [Bradyrhizobium sp.]MDO8400352.1 heme-binding protein [Bradyrhizobium sp.]
MQIFQSIYSSFASVVAAVVSIFGVNMGTEQPRYDVLERFGDKIEIRQYGPRVAAETIVDASTSDNARGDAFRLIAGYIFGANKTSENVAMTSPVEISSPGTKIAMTAPVEVNKSADGLVMRFFMPSKYSIDQLPEPSNPRVKLTQMPSTTVAVLRFTGSTGDPAVTTRTAELIRSLETTKWKIVGPATAFFYNPPWAIPFLRTNEVVIPVTK